MTVVESGTLTLGDVATLIIDYRGKTPSKLGGEWAKKGIPAWSAKNIKNGNFVNPESVKFVNEQLYEKWMKEKIRAGDVLMTSEAPLGETFYYKNNEPIVLSQRLFAIRLNSKKCDPKYFYQLTKTSDFQNTLHSFATGATVSGIRQALLWKLPLSLLSLDKQKKVAVILSAYDDLIENNARRIKILEEMAQLIYREWFVQFRFPGHEKVCMVDSPFGKIPEGWKYQKLESLCQRITDGSHWSPKTMQDGMLMASVKDMHNWGIDVNACRRINKEDFDNLVRNDCKPLKDDVLIAKDGSYLKHAFVVREEIEMVVLSSIAILRPNGELLPDLFVMILQDPVVKGRLKGCVSGAALPRIILKDFRNFQVIVPNAAVQKQWSEIVKPMLDLCFVLIKKNENLKKSRNMLLPKLISGELDVSELDIEIPMETK